MTIFIASTQSLILQLQYNSNRRYSVIGAALTQEEKKKKTHIQECKYCAQTVA